VTARGAPDRVADGAGEKSGATGTLKRELGRRRWRLALQALLAGASITLLVWRLDLGDAVRLLPRADFRWALLAVLLFSISRVLYAYRWRHFMWRHESPSVLPLTGIFVLANLVNALVPLRAGDVLRIQMSHRRFGVGRSELTSNVMLTETVLDALAFVLLMLAVLPFLAVPFLSEHEVIAIAVAVVVAFLALVVLARIAARAGAGGAPPDWVRRALGRRLSAWVPGVLEGFASLRSWRRTGLVIAISLAIRLLEAGVFWTIGLAFALDLPPAAYVVVMVAVGLVVTMPLVPWNIGTYEVAVTEVAVLLGADRGVASAFAVGSHVLLLVWMAVTAAVAMRAMRIGPRDIF
jgi:uncharacterized protein (TIRG00374 family)